MQLMLMLIASLTSNMVCVCVCRPYMLFLQNPVSTVGVGLESAC